MKRGVLITVLLPGGTHVVGKARSVTLARLAWRFLRVPEGE